MIPVFKPLIEVRVRRRSCGARLGWLGMGSYVSDFEKAILDTLVVPIGTWPR